MSQRNSDAPKLIATVIEAKGYCSAGHKQGDKFTLSIHDTDGLCGNFYHNIFGSISTYQFGGKYPWFEDGIFFANCPDPKNEISIRVEINGSR